MLPPCTGIIGMGLMGGSLARELADRGARVFAHDLDPDIVSAALAEGIAHGSLGVELDQVTELDLIVIATPVGAAIEALRRIAPRLPENTVVTDVGSAKRGIVAEAVALGIGDRFVGSHPLTGDHRSGWRASRRGLYVGMPVFLCHTPVTADWAAARVEALWTALGALPKTIDPDEHDRRMAWISHLPQVVSSALALSLAGAQYQPGDLGPGGRDVARLAASSPDMWTAICTANADYLTIAIADLQSHLEAFRTAVENAEPEALRTFFRDARDWLA